MLEVELLDDNSEPRRFAPDLLKVNKDQFLINAHE